MPLECYSEHVEYFALVPIGRSPDWCDTFDFSVVVAEQDLESEPLVMFRAEKMIVDLKPRIFLRSAVSPAKVGQHVETKFYLQKITGVVNGLARSNYSYFAESISNRGYPSRILVRQLVHKYVEILSHIKSYDS